MIKYFEDNVVLTSQNPEAFLVFQYDGSILEIEPSLDAESKNLYINGWDTETLSDASSAGLTLSSSVPIAAFHLYTDSKEDFDYNVPFSYEAEIDTSVNLYWDDGDWGGVVTISGNNLIDASTVDAGDFLFTDPIPVGGSSKLDASIFYSLYGPGEPDPIFRIYQYGPGFTLDASYDPYLLSWDGNPVSLTTIIDPSATNVVLFWTAPDQTSGTHPCAFDVSSNWMLTTPSATINIDVSVYNRPFVLDANEFNSFDTTTPLVDNEASYLLLRSNPKYSGNVKLMIDPSDNMFLDTFKVSEILSNKKYRNQKVSGNSFLSSDVRRVFETLPEGEIYRLGSENSLDISSPKTDYFEQYNTTYSYGARLLKDELYEDDYSILAPMWMNSKIPDFFGIFRIDGTFNEETYDYADLADLAKKYIEDGDLIKSWSLKENAPVGNYLNNHLTELLKVQSPVNLSLNEYDPNTWYGIAVDKGIIAGRSEVPYFFQKVADNFTDLNAFVSQGFERQGLLCPNLLNLEFAFSDDDVSTYTMHRYFGFYLSENEMYKIAYYSDEPDSSVGIISLDGKNVQDFIDSSIFDSNGDVSTAYDNRIFVRNAGDELIRVCCTEQFDTTPGYIEEYTNKLGKNILTTEAELKLINPFISFRINSVLKQGETLRVISSAQDKIWEVYGTATDVFDATEAGPYVSYAEPSVGYPTIYRTAFSTKGDIEDQINALEKAFNLFSKYEDVAFTIGMKKSNTLSLIINDEYKDDDMLFQRLTSQIVDTPGDSSSNFNSAAEYDDISFYNIIDPTIDDFSRISPDSSYGPINFELYGDRMSLMINIINPEGYYTYALDSSISDLFTDNVLYEAGDGWNRLIQEFDISTGIEYTSKYVEDPTSSNNDCIIITEYQIDLAQDNLWYGYDVYPISISLMGINDVKDMDFTVYDSTSGMDFKSSYNYDRAGDEDTYNLTLKGGETKIIEGRNSFQVLSGVGSIEIDGSILAYSNSDERFNTFFGEAVISASTPTIITYNILDGSYNYSGYDPSISEENIDDYYKENFLLDSSGNEYPNKIALKYGLVIPTISKWGGIGKDVRNNDVRLSLTNDFFPDASDVNSNFIPGSDSSTYSTELSYPVFKYLDPGDVNWEDYVYYDVSDVVLDGSTRLTTRELIFEKPYVDVFSKIMYNNHGVSGKNLRSSIVYYNLYKNEVSTIIKGISLGLAVTAAGEKLSNVKNWDRYRISFISSPSITTDHNHPIEVIVNENTETILIIWYQGNDVLNYSKRWSSYLPGKSNLIDINSTGDKRFTSFNTGDPSYAYVKAPFIVDTANIVLYTENMYDTSTFYNSDVCQPFAQFSYNTKNDINSVFNAYGTNSVANNIFSFTDSFNSFDQNEINYAYLNNSISFGTNISNIASSYVNNNNSYLDITCEYDLFKDIISRNDVMYWILQGDDMFSNNDFSSAPVVMTVYDPIEYLAPGADSSIYTFNGGYRPIFKNILNFDDNETSELINIVEKDFIFGNTSLQSYNSIEQYWFNRVVEEVTSSDSSNNILYAEDYNPFLSLWDKDYYVLSNGSVETKIDGYNSNGELPALFGSKLIALPDTLELELWNSGNSRVVQAASYYSLEYNLSKTINQLFTSNYTFIQNWSGLPTVSDDIINRYIIKTVLEYYNISIDKIGTEVWDKVYDGTILATEYDNTFTNKISNLDTNLSYENGEYFYKIRVDNTEHRSYFSKFTFNKK